MTMFGQALPMGGLQREEKPSMEVYPEGFEMDQNTFLFGWCLCVPVRR
jgi:hypothetical protein